MTVPLLRKPAVCSSKTGSFMSSSSSFNFTWLSIERLINLFSLRTALSMSAESLILAPKAFVLYGYVAGFGSVNFRGGRGATGAGFLLTAFNVSFKGSFIITYNTNISVGTGLFQIRKTERHEHSFLKIPNIWWHQTFGTLLEFNI